MNSVLPTSFVFRVWQQFNLEWRMQWFLVLLWLAAVATDCWQSLQEERPYVAMPGFLPGLLGLLIIVRSVRADAPGNTEVTSHVRPLGRGAVWLAKVAFFKIALLLPWLASDWLQWSGYGYGPVEWLAAMAGSALPTVFVGACAGLLVSWSGTARRNVVLSVMGLAMVIVVSWMLNGKGPDMDAERCVMAVALLILNLTLLLAWWQTAMMRRAWVTLLLGGVMTVLVAKAGRWDWRAQPELRYVEAKLKLHVGERPEGAAQELWKGVYVTGLPVDCVAAVVAFAPAPVVGEAWPPKTAYSDYTWPTDAQKGKVRLRKHWMGVSHTRALVGHYPAGALWREKNDWERVSEQGEFVGGKAAGPWRLRLAVQSMERVATMPLRDAIRAEKRVVLDTGRRLDFQLNVLSHDSEMRFWAMLRRRFPLLAPRKEQEGMRVVGKFPEENFLMVLNSPGIGEVNTACEGEDNVSSNDRYWQRADKRPVGFEFPHPRAQMDIAGLTLDAWVDGTTLDVWWPEERGVVDLEVSAEEMGRVMEAR